MRNILLMILCFVLFLSLTAVSTPKNDQQAKENITAISVEQNVILPTESQKAMVAEQANYFVYQKEISEISILKSNDSSRLIVDYQKYSTDLNRNKHSPPLNRFENYRQHSKRNC